MLKTRVIPTLLMREVNLVKGPAFDSWRAVGSPMQSVKVFNRREVDELILLDIGATPGSRQPDYEQVAILAQECFVPLTVGGGVSSVEAVRRLLLAGADKVAVNTAVYDTPELVTESARHFGQQCIVVGIDYRVGESGHAECFSRCGTVATGRDPVAWAKEVERAGAGEIQLTAIDRDGLMGGYDLDMLREVAAAVSIPVIASGGAGSYEHMRAAVQGCGSISGVSSQSLPVHAGNPLEAKIIPRRRWRPRSKPSHRLMRIVAIIQARMGSSRLPGKVLMPLGGVPVIQHVIQRVGQTAGLMDLVVATTEREIDDHLAEAAEAFGARVVRGDEADVLSRYGLAASAASADAIIRVTADCPLIDPDILGAMISRFKAARSSGADLALVTNARLRTFPRGLDAELFTRESLEIMLVEACAPYEREHVTPFLYEHPERFLIEDFVAAEDYSSFRWTLDTLDDYRLLEHVFGAVDNSDSLRLRDVLALLASNPEWSSLNAHVEQKKYK